MDPCGSQVKECGQLYQRLSKGIIKGSWKDKSFGKEVKLPVVIAGCGSNTISAGFLSYTCDLSSVKAYTDFRAQFLK